MILFPVFHFTFTTAPWSKRAMYECSNFTDRNSIKDIQWLAYRCPAAIDDMPFWGNLGLSKLLFLF